MKNKKFYIIFIVSMILFGTIGILRKNIIYSSGLIAFSRALIGSVMLLIILLFKRVNPFKNVGFKKMILLIVAGICLTSNWVFLFEAFKRTTVSSTTLILYLEPSFVFLYSIVFKKEKAEIKKVICLIFAFIGMVFISGIFTDRSDIDILGLIFAFTASVLYSLLAIINREIEDVDNYQKTFIELFFGMIILIPYIIFNGDFKELEYDLKSIIMLLISGVILTGFVYILYFSSLGKISSSSFSILSYLDPITALILSFVILKESMNIFLIIGAILIILSSIISEVKLNKKTSDV